MNTRQSIPRNPFNKLNVVLNVVALVIVATCADFVTAQETGNSGGSRSGWESNLGRAIESSKESGRPVMLVFSGSDWCIWCQRLEREVFQTAEFKKWSAESVIKVMVDFPQNSRLPNEIAGQNEYLKQHFSAQLSGFPTVLFVEAGGSVIGKSGYVAGGPGSWIEKANVILNINEAGTPSSSRKIR